MESAALIQDVKGSGVRINIPSPGAADTPSLRMALGKAAKWIGVRHRPDQYADVLANVG
jgi:hypothetical protein